VVVAAGVSGVVIGEPGDASGVVMSEPGAVSIDPPGFPEVPISVAVSFWATVMPAVADAKDAIGAVLISAAARSDTAAIDLIVFISSPFPEPIMPRSEA